MLLSTIVLKNRAKRVSVIPSVAAGAKNFWGGHKQTESTGDLVQAP